MADWQVTATTIYCPDVDDEVTLLVYGDGVSKCTAREKYARPDKPTAQSLKKKGKETGKQLVCGGSECRHIIEYRRKWLGK
jgi:hypothetical protein